MVIDNDAKYIINVDTHAISCWNPTPVGQYDHNTELKTFVCPNKIEGINITEFNIKRILFTNGNSTGVYDITDITNVEGDKVVFTWLISQQGTQKSGKLYFSVEFRKTDSNGVIEKSWQSAIFDGQKVLPGYEFDIGAIQEYIDILERWKNNLMNYPIIQNGTWWTWNGSQEKYVNTGYSADGALESKNAAAKSASDAAESLRQVQHIIDVLPKDTQALLDKVASSIYVDNEGYLCLDKEITING